MLEQRDVDDCQGNHETRDQGKTRVSFGNHGADSGPGTGRGRGGLG